MKKYIYTYVTAKDFFAGIESCREVFSESEYTWGVNDATLIAAKNILAVVERDYNHVEKIEILRRRVAEIGPDTFVDLEQA